MTAGQEPTADPGNQRDDAVQLPKDALRLFQEVATGYDKSQTVVWKNAVSSLQATNQYLETCVEARNFMERYMYNIIGILVEQEPNKIGQMERSCVEESLDLAVAIVAKDLRIQLVGDGECNVLNVLECIFTKRKKYYKGSKSTWNAHLNGLPEVRMRMIEKFRLERGFWYLSEYMSKRIKTPQFPSLDFINQVLVGVEDALLPDRNKHTELMEKDAIRIAQVVIEFIGSCSEDQLKKMNHEALNMIRTDLYMIYDNMMTRHRQEAYAFYDFWRGLTLKLMSSQSLPLKLFGWDQASFLIDSAQLHRPPAKKFHVSGAGCTFTNGEYQFVGQVSPDGYAIPQSEISYVRKIPETEKDGGGKTLTLFRCTMRSQQKWWFLSEADEEQPGTDRDIDYYQHKSKEHEEREPPPDNWITCRNAGIDPPPTLRGEGLMVPPGEEYNTLEHQLARWATENGIVELVLGDSLHREIVARSTPLIKFLASMCERDAIEGYEGSMKPNTYCLQDAHLLLAWKTCTSKADAAVSTEVYQLLVTILPNLSSGMAVTLLSAVQMSLEASTEKRDFLPEVAEFCSKLAESVPVDKTGQVLGLQGISDDVRKEILHLMWTLLTHPDASSLKSYDNLKRYVANELRLEPSGAESRKFFLKSCTETLLQNSQRKPGNGVVDELHVLRAVKLTQFVLQACPREQTIMFVSERDGALPLLLFNELIAYMGRRNADLTMSPAQKRNGAGEVKHDVVAALSERLDILRYVYGISDQVKLSIGQLHHLWKLCSVPSDREALMIFIADASGSDPSPSVPGPALVDPQPVAQVHKPQPDVRPEPLVAAAFPDDVRTSAFLDLFCSISVNWGELGEGSYRSFQSMFKKLRQSPEASMATSAPALDALWRICLNAGNDSVASEAMSDLLAVYTAMAGVTRSQNAWTDERMSPTGSDSMKIDTGEDSFGNRVFQCLVEVQKGLKAGTISSERSAERCLRILNAAVSHDGSSGRSVSSTALDSLSSVSNVADLQNALASLPHGMRGQSCYRRIGVMAKRPPNPPGNVSGLGNMSGLSTLGGKENVQASGPKASTIRFTLYVHPLETLASIKEKVAKHCECSVTSVKTMTVSGRQPSTSNNRAQGNDSAPLSLNLAADDSIVDQLGIRHGCELIVVLAEKQTGMTSNAPTAKKTTDGAPALNVSEIFTGGGEFAHRLFETLLGVLELLPWRETENNMQVIDSHKLVWDLLLAIPTNRGIMERVRSTARAGGDKDAMVLDSPQERWSDHLDRASFHHSVYVMQVIESFLQPAPESLAILSPELRAECEKSITEDAASFRMMFIQSGGFDAVVRWFSAPVNQQTQKQSERRMGNAVALRILKCCLFGSSQPVVSVDSVQAASLDEAGKVLLQSLSDTRGLLKCLASMVVLDDGIASATILDVLRFLWLLFGSAQSTQVFVTLPDSLAEKFLVTLLLWEGGPDSIRTNAMFGNATRIRREAHDLILKVPILAKHSLPWLIGAMDKIDVTSDATVEYFDVLRRLVEAEEGAENKTTGADLQALGTAVCKKLLSCPRPTNDGALSDFSTGVLCGCLQLLRAIIETGGSHALKTGANILLKDLKIARWSEQTLSPSAGVLQQLSSSFRGKPRADDATLIDLMGALFDGFLSPGGSSSVVAICCDKDSRSLGFDAVATAARACQGHDGYVALVHRINGIVKAAEPHLRHKWNQNGGGNDGHSRSLRTTAKYSGLRNQGCTCYMNSFLQQMFMMPDLRGKMCSAPLPASLRTSGGSFAKGAELIGKKLSVQWDSGVSYDAMVEGFDAKTGMHTIRYCPMPVATVGPASGHQQIHPEEITRMPPDLQQEFHLSEGRPGKETGVFEIVEASTSPSAGEGTSEKGMQVDGDNDVAKETEDEISSRHLLEEVQRTFIHLDEGSRGRCFDPRALVEACACLKLEFDVWQQNDASEFAMKLLDRMEIALKKWAPEHFRYLDHTFGLKQTKQKVCKECGLKTNREENLMNIDCQIRGKSDIHEALSTMCEVELMEGNNKVFCDRCKKNTDTVLKTAISALPDMLILSLKRFDLDYNTFETVKLNSRCEFGQTLNMKRYTLEGIEALEKSEADVESSDGTPMETDDGQDDENDPVDPLSSLPDEDYEYRLAGVLVHAGVAQGGHYYSFIKDRTPGADADKWYRFDDEDVTPFDPSSIEDECFGGLIAKDPKWSHGAVQTQERFANALMLFYEKVKPAKKPEDPSEEMQKVEEAKIEKTTGYDVFTPDVRQSNATHRWQTFLFDAEFQEFLKGLLSLCQRSRASKDPIESGSMRHMNDSSWQGNILDMLCSFFFDVLLYSAQRGSVNDWVMMLTDIFMNDGETAKRFVRSLAERTRTVSSNWLKTYLTDCPEQDARIAVIRVFSAGILACAAYNDEQESLRKWAMAWKAQVGEISPGRAVPTRLEGRWQELESFTSSKASNIGVILSYLTCLLEVAPRTWRYNSDLGLLIRDLSNARPEYGGFFLREAMEAAEFPARLICLVSRDRTAPALQAAFPGATVSLAAAESQARAETNPSAHVMPMASGQLVGAPDRGTRHAPGQPCSADYCTLIEALGCLIGVKGVVHAPLVVESEETPRGRHVVLSNQFEDALKTMFQESCSNPAGMVQRDVERYLQRCGFDRGSVSPLKINEILSRYSTFVGGKTVLSRDGFLAYYKETVQTHDKKVRLELHQFGYRPDLSRRSPESRLKRDHSARMIAESVALDIAERGNENPSGDEALSRFTSAALPSFTFFAHAFNASEPMADHILVKVALDWPDCIPELITVSLRAIHGVAKERWAGADQTWHAALMIFRTLAAIPDELQDKRIGLIMECDEKSHAQSDFGIGLLVAPQEVQPTSRRYNQEARYAYECYRKAIEDLASMCPAVTRWLNNNSQLWSWMERDMSRVDVGGRQQARVEHSRREESHQQANTAFETYTPRSDSDMHHQDSDDDEEDEYDDNYYGHGREMVFVHGAGLDVVNGEYERNNVFDGVGKYVKTGLWQDQNHEFSLFRCNTSNNHKYWYISIVPMDVQPGTSTDIDFYSAPVSRQDPDFPPEHGWTVSSEGKAPAPQVSVQFSQPPTGNELRDSENQPWVEGNNNSYV